MRLHSLRLLNQNCRTAARLLSDSQERTPSLTEALGLQVHLILCGHCRRYRTQVSMMAVFLDPRRAGDLPAALPLPSRHRIERRLAEFAKGIDAEE